MQTPFYVIKRTAVTKEAATAKFYELMDNDDRADRLSADLIDFCLSGGTEEKVFIEPGMRVRIKSMPEGAFDYDSPGVGSEGTLTDVCFWENGIAFSLHTDDAFNYLRINGDNLDLSEYLELVLNLSNVK